MDLGAVLCRPTSPRCECCPLADGCAWRGSGVDPAPGSAGVSVRQARFDGSDRQARGKLLKALVAGPVRADRCAGVMGCDDARATRLVDALEREGLVVREAMRYDSHSGMLCMSTQLAIRIPDEPCETSTGWCVA